MPSSEQIVILIAAFLAVWYVLASIYNRRRGRRAFHWLRQGLDVLGGQYEGKWLGTAASGAQLIVNKAQPPFRRVELIFLLESRELLPLWLADILRGKRDQVIIKATLRRVMPAAEVEVAPLNGRLAHYLKKESKRPYQLREQNGLLIAERGAGATAVAQSLAPLLDQYAPYVRHISWSPNAPHLIAIFNLSALIENYPHAAELLTTLKKLEMRSEK